MMDLNRFRHFNWSAFLLKILLFNFILAQYQVYIGFVHEKFKAAHMADMGCSIRFPSQNSHFQRKVEEVLLHYV